MTAADGDRMYDPLPDGAVIRYGDLHRAWHADPARLDEMEREGGR